jgi:putative ATP-binding cassette transporter
VLLYRRSQSQKGSHEDERSRLSRLFAAITFNWRKTLVQTFRLDIGQQTFIVGAAFLAAVLLAPAVLDGRATIGDVTQTQLAFTFVALAVSWFAQTYLMIAMWSASAHRLLGLSKELDAIGDEAAPDRCEAISNLQVRDLTVRLPSGEQLLSVPRFTLHAGERVLVRGAAGAGKTTLLRSLAGLWPEVDGTVELPKGARVVYVPQKSYLVPGTLRMNLAYPSPIESASDDQCTRVLDCVGLERFADQLDVSANWSQKLSGGEQQRLMVARAILAKPDFLILDESTAALDGVTEARVYQSLLEELPGCALLTVGHKQSLNRFHQRALCILDGRLIDDAKLDEPDGRTTKRSTGETDLQREH